MASMRRSAIVSCMPLGIVERGSWMRFIRFGWGLFGSSVFFSSSLEMVSEERTRSRDSFWPVVTLSISLSHGYSLFFILLTDPHTKVSAVVKVKTKAIETIEINATTALMAGKGVVSRT